MPLITSNVNIKFNGTLENAVVLKDSNGVKTLIPTDDLSAHDLALLTAFVNDYGGNAPLASATAGVARVAYASTTAGATATGLSNVSAATPATATIDVGGNKAAGTASGLSTAVGTAGVQRVNFEPARVGATATGLANDTTAYTMTVTVNGTPIAVSVVGSAAQTWTNLITEINTNLGASATASISGGDLLITSATQGTSSKVRITDGNLLSTLTGFISILPPQDGDATGRTYTATVTVDGVLKSISFAGTSGTTFGDVITQINTDLGGAATAAITNGNIVITSATSGTASSVQIYDTGLFAALTGFAGFTYTAGAAPTIYRATVTVDGVAKAVAVQGSAAQTFTTLLAEINTDLGASATATLSGGKIVITSATTGTSSSVVIVDDGLFKSAAGFVAFETPVAGASDLVVEMKKRLVGSSTLFDLFNVKTVGAKPAVPAVPATLPKTPHFTYFDGAVWKYLADDTEVNP